MQKKILDKQQIRKTVLQVAVFALILFAVLGLFALKAYAACAHIYDNNGNCQVCGYTCLHDETRVQVHKSYGRPSGLLNTQHFTYNYCDECHYSWTTTEKCVAANPLDSSPYCMYCDYYIGSDDKYCFHNFQLGICTKCGYSCPHPGYQDSVCTRCNMTCSHSNVYYYYNQSSSNLHKHILAPYCADCDIGLLTSHPDVAKAESCTYDNKGVCTKCKRSCLHESGFENGKCIICNYGCGHSAGSTYTYEPLSNSSIYHSVKAWCKTCGERNTADPQNGAHVKCTFSSGKCSKCKRSCSHSAVETTYTVIPNDYTQHSITVTCSICFTVTSTSYGSHGYDMQNVCQSCFLECTHERWTDGKCTYCKNTCAHSSYSNGKCASCGITCKHPSKTTRYTQRANDYGIHNVITTCNICNLQTSSTTANHTYSGTKCSACSMQCIHERWTDGNCTYCSYACQHATYKDGNCSTCGKACAHSNTTITYTQRANDYGIHNVITTCNTCNQQISSDTANHTYSGTKCSACSMQCIHERWTDGNCTYCSYACQHTFEKTECIICNTICQHPSILVRTVGTEKNQQEFYCATCYFVSPRYDIPLAYTQYFSYLPAPCTWNANSTVMTEKSSFLDYDSYFERYTIKVFDEAFGYNASTHILGGSSIKDSVAFDAPIQASRYLLLRVRLSGINHLEIYAYGGDSAVSFDDVTSECSSLHFFDIESLPDNEWCNLAIDMSLFDDVPDSTYSVGDSISHAFMTLCFTYEDTDSFADIAYFALCDDLSDIDLVNNFSAIYPLSHEYYLADGERSVNSTVAHDFDISGVCKNCLYACEHTNTYTLDVITNTDCGNETRCALCDVLTSSSVDGHLFTDNSDTCSKCSFVCAHRYSGGLCMYCEWSCKHTHPDGSIKCSNCGYYVDYEGYNDPAGFHALFTAIYDAQANTFFKMLGYEILGVNIAGLIVSVIALAIVFWLLKKVL